MNINKKHLTQASEQRIISLEQAEQLWTFWQQQNQHIPSFQFIHVLYYLGGLLAIGAMSLFMTLGFGQFGGVAIVLLSMGYGVLGFVLTEHFRAKNLPIPSGVCAAFMLVLVPLAVFGIQDMLGFWQEHQTYRDYHRWIDWRWLTMEMITIVAGGALFWRYRYGFLMMPITFTIWYLSMDLADFWEIPWQQRKMMALLWGLVLLGVALYADIKQQKNQQDYAFWLYLIGAILFWGGLSSMDSDNELGKFIYFCINVIMVLFGVVIQRRIFTILGALGMMGYLGHLSYKVFKDSWLFPIILTMIGLGIVCLGVYWQKNQRQWREKLLSLLPTPWQAFLAQKY